MTAGVVAVFDDLTLLNRAQRDAAWSEVARRLAHEVKNPLTPIQLAAERLRRGHRSPAAGGNRSARSRDAHDRQSGRSAQGASQCRSETTRALRKIVARPLLLHALVGEVLGFVRKTISASS